MFKMRTDTSDPSATESWLIPIESGWDKGKHKEQTEKGNENCRRWGHKDASEWHERNKKRNRLTEFEAVRRLRWWPQSRHKRVGRKTQKRACLVWSLVL